MLKFIPVYEPDLSGNELDYVTDCIESSWISSLGKYVDLFEKSFASFCGVKHAIAVSNGTVSLHLALILRDVGPGDEVILPTLTFVATANVVKYTGATPVFVDVDEGTWNINPNLVEEKITARTKAIIPVHLYGNPSDMGQIMEIAEKYGLYVVEDAAEAHGAEYRGLKVGSIGHIGSFSFYGNKVVTTGEGGMLTTNDDILAGKARLLKDHGMSKEIRYWHTVVGYNYRITNIQAAIGYAQLERIEKIISRKIEIANLYNGQLGSCPAITCHPQAEWAKNIYWMYSILITENSKLDRDQVMAGLREQGIDSRPFFIPMHQLPPYSKYQDKFYPVAEDLSRRGINLPSYPTLFDEDIIRICNAIKGLVACN